MIYAGLNQTQEACCWLETGYEERAAHMLLPMQPWAKSLREKWPAARPLMESTGVSW